MTDAKADPTATSHLEELTHWKDEWCGKIGKQEEEGTTEDEAAGITDSMGLSLKSTSYWI